MIPKPREALHTRDRAKTGVSGENLVTAYPGGNYAAVSGTSFAAALMSGAASELLIAQKGLAGNSPQVSQFLNPFYVLTSFASAGALQNQVGGYGVVNLVNAAHQAQNYQQH